MRSVDDLFREAWQLVKESECPECRGASVAVHGGRCRHCKGVGVDPGHPRFLEAVDDRMMQSDRWFRQRQALIEVVKRLHLGWDVEVWLDTLE